ncbi:MAG: CDP-glucose 4,6-dehydratase [Ferrovibrio sp.]|uniref:CDP-glucose 4,6-dehydratase n=1 Tax=Ferrovibrio sp. TaxID=1917215 RepID=UPI00261A8ABF|nr:CDP-glucose 4,6-dehydratase [Ferrovibrio sp.]MCW0234907.1 CDP-glucose 4,6-dehydratase [Ferrovibrio sp.]
MGLTREFWRDRRVLLTGHTGFKGAWAARWLRRLGAEVYGFALPPDTRPSLHALLQTPLAGEWLADLRDAGAVDHALTESKPDLVLHLAAQALVPASYRDPLGTWTSNVLGTLHLLEAMRRHPQPMTAVIVTTDKVYANNESGAAFPETAPLGGDDPYSASKAATEIAVHSWMKSFFAGRHKVGTARAGNVIGGGDWSANRLIPDIVRAAQRQGSVVLRRPDATRPWQHVLDPVHGYLLYAEALHAQQTDLPASLNFGPLEDQRITVGTIATDLTRAFGAPMWRHEAQDGIGEKGVLALDARLAAETLQWHPQFSTQAALDATVTWYRDWLAGGDAAALTDCQIADFEDGL